MAKAANDKTKTKNRPALSVEAREAHLISLAEDLAEQQLRDGTASSQLITHYLKLGSTRERLEKKLLAVGVGEVVYSYMYFVYTADRDYVVYQLGDLSCL